MNRPGEQQVLFLPGTGRLYQLCCPGLGLRSPSRKKYRYDPGLDLKVGNQCGAGEKQAGGACGP